MTDISGYTLQSHNRPRLMQRAQCQFCRAVFSSVTPNEALEAVRVHTSFQRVSS
jgi:hypothetical protein